MSVEEYELRRDDYSLSETQESVRRSFADVLSRECPSSRVRDAEPVGYDEALWRRLLALGAVSMALPAAVGGDDATLVELALVAEEYGRVLAPVPLVEAAVTARLLARSGLPVAGGWATGIGAGDRLATLALHPAGRGMSQLVPAGALAEAVVALDGDELVLVTDPVRPPHVPNQGAAPLAWWAPSGDRQVLARGHAARDLFAAATAEWKVLTAAALVGLADAVKLLGVEFARSRRTMGVPIGALQAVSHPLADVEILVSGARNLVRKAAWFAAFEPAARPDLVPMAIAHAHRTAGRACAVALHVQGGFGYTRESDVTLFFRRAKGWSLLAGDPDAELSAVVDTLADTSAAPD